MFPTDIFTIQSTISSFITLIKYSACMFVDGRCNSLQLVAVIWWFFLTVHHRLISFTNFNAQFLYTLTICVLHYNPPHVSSISMPIFGRTNCIITASGIVTLCKRLYSMPDESRLLCSLLSSGILYCTVLYRVTIPDAVIIQFALLKIGMLMLETCRGL